MSYEYPTAPIPSYPVNIEAVWTNISSSFDSGKEQSRQKNLYPKYDVTLTYKALTSSNMQLLWNFYQARRGAFEPFYFYSPDLALWKGIFIGIGDGSTLTFDLPGKSTTAHIIYQGGAITSSALYTLSYGAGDCSSDRITFTVAPPLNTLITLDFTGYLRIRCKFKDDKLTRSAFNYCLFTTGLNLKGLAAV